MYKKIILFAFLVGGLVLPGRAWAHGGASLEVAPPEAAVGAEITLTGAEMEDGEVFTLTLEGLFDTFRLGEATVTDEGFSIVVTIPAEASSGLYSVVAVSEEGESVRAEITVLPAGTATGARPAEPFVATAEKMALDRPRTTATWLLAAITILAGSIGGIWLVKEEK